MNDQIKFRTLELYSTAFIVASMKALQCLQCINSLDIGHPVSNDLRPFLVEAHSAPQAKRPVQIYGRPMKFMSLW